MSFYKFICSILSFLARILYRVEIVGAENIPDEGNIIVIANHKHFLDPVFMLIAIKNRRIIPVAKKELFDVFILKNILKKLEVIPIDRGNPSISTVKEIINQIKSGRILGIFPEGTRCMGNNFLPAKPGVAMFAIKTKADIVPMSIITNFKLFSKVKIVIGETIDMSEYKKRKVNKEEYAEISQKCFDVVVKNYFANMKGVIKE